MSEYIYPAIFVTVFTIFFVGMMSTASIGSFVEDGELEELNISEEDLEFTPNIPAPRYEVIDLENFEDSSNVVVADASEYNETDWPTEKFVRLDDQSESGWVLYSVSSGTEVLNTKVTKYGFLEASNIQLEEYVTTNEDPTSTQYLSRKQSISLQDSTNFVRITINASDDRLYELEEQTEESQGFFGTVVAYAESFGGAIASWLALFGALPQVLKWATYIIGIIVAIIAAEILLW